MEKPYHILYRYAASLRTLGHFFAASLRRWPFFSWCRFWFTRRGVPPYEYDTARIAIRTGRWREKVIDAHMAFTCITEEQYFPAGCAVRENDTVIDIGAHIGSFSLLAARRGAARIVACEPEPRNFAQLAENITRNHCGAIRALPICVAGADGERLLTLDRENSARNGLYGKGARRLPVRALSLPTIFAQEKIERCDFLKMDCEGAEYEIVAAAPRTLLARIRCIALEYHLPPYFGLDRETHRPADLVATLADAGFVVRLTQENRLRGLLFAVRQDGAAPAGETGGR